MPTWTVALSSPRLPAATRSWSPMKVLPLRPPAGKVCLGTVWNTLEKRCGELFRLISCEAQCSGPALEIAGMSKFEGEGGRLLGAHMKGAEWFCRAAGPSPPEARAAPSVLWVGIFFAISLSLEKN